MHCNVVPNSVEGFIILKHKLYIFTYY